MSAFKKIPKQPLPQVEDWGWMDIPDVTPKNPTPYTGSSVLLGKLWKIALDDIEKSHNTQTEFGTVFSAGAYGKDFCSLVFSRDNAYAGLLGLNCLYPQEMLESYKAIRQVRYRLGWSCFKVCGSELKGIPDVPVYDMKPLEFFRKFQKASAINKTDDVAWVWAAYDLLKKQDFPRTEWEWLYENGQLGFDKFYQAFYDETDGLYFGQPTFIDVGHCGYPDGYNTPTTKRRNKCVWLKATSTNSLYYKALCVMAETARLLDKADEATAWQSRADALKTAILRHLRAPDGTFYYFRYRDGRAEQRREALGSAFPVLCGVVEGEDAVAAVAGYPITPFGVPLLYPYYPRHDSYHNNTMWPFADTFFLLAYERANGVSTAEVNLLGLVNAFKNGHFYELHDAKTNTPMGSWAQLWTTAAFLNAMIRAGNTGIEPDKNILY